MPEGNEGVEPSQASGIQRSRWRKKIEGFLRRRSTSVALSSIQPEAVGATEEQIVAQAVQDAVSAQAQDIFLASALHPENIPVDLRQEYETRRDEIENLYSQAAYWHGTGRKQYRNGEAVDILDRIIDQAGLVPQRDPFNTRTGVTYTVSLSDRRMYSAGYARMHLSEGQSLSYEYMSGDFWGIFLRNTIREAMGKTTLEGVKKLGTILWSNFKEGVSPTYLLSIGKNARNWTAKVTRKKYKQRLAKAFTVHSDIPGNYPILIGVKTDSFTHAPAAGFISLYEVRSNTPIPFSSFTHIEVPKAHIQETTQMLTQKGITTVPVIPMELGEIHSSQFTPQQLIDGNSFRK